MEIKKIYLFILLIYPEIGFFFLYKEEIYLSGKTADIFSSAQALLEHRRRGAPFHTESSASAIRSPKPELWETEFSGKG